MRLSQEEAPAPAPVDNSPLGRLRNKNRLNIQPKSKSASAASASSPVQVRRVLPITNRRKLPGQTTEAPSSEAPVSEASEPGQYPFHKPNSQLINVTFFWYFRRGNRRN